MHMKLQNLKDMVLTMDMMVKLDGCMMFHLYTCLVGPVEKKKKRAKKKVRIKWVGQVRSSYILVTFQNGCRVLTY